MISVRLRLALLWAIVCVLLARPSWPQDMKPHGNHDPHHGGIVLMYGMDLHYEIVLSPAGHVQLWLSDGARDDLPAAIVSDVVVEIERSGGQREAVDMTMGKSGAELEGKASAVKGTEREAPSRVCISRRGGGRLVPRHFTDGRRP